MEASEQVDDDCLGIWALKIRVLPTGWPSATRRVWHWQLSKLPRSLKFRSKDRSDPRPPPLTQQIHSTETLKQHLPFNICMYRFDHDHFCIPIMLMGILPEGKISVSYIIMIFNFLVWNCDWWLPYIFEK